MHRATTHGTAGKTGWFRAIFMVDLQITAYEQLSPTLRIDRYVFCYRNLKLSLNMSN